MMGEARAARWVNGVHTMLVTFSEGVVIAPCDGSSTLPVVPCGRREPEPRLIPTNLSACTIRLRE